MTAPKTPLISAAVALAARAEPVHQFGDTRKLNRRKAPEDLDKLAGELKTRMTKLDELITRYADQLENPASLAKEDRELLDRSSNEVTELAARFSEMEQKLVEQVNTRKADAETVGALLTRNDSISKQVAAIQSRRGRTTIDGIQARNIVTIAGMGATAPLANAVLNERPEQMLALINLIQWQPTTSALVPLLRESGYDIMADVVAEGAAKPQSNLTFGVTDIKIDVVAHWIKISKQVLDDMSALAAYIEGRLAYGVRLKLEALVINADTASFSGLMAADNSLPAVPVYGETAIDTLNTAKYQAWSAMLPPEIILLNPVDWGKIERLKGSDGHYIFGSPGAMVQPVLWGVPVVLSAAMAEGKFWIGNLTIGVSGYTRQDVAVELSTEDGDNFQKNLVTVRAEMRAGFGVAVPDACVSGDLVELTPPGP